MKYKVGDILYNEANRDGRKIINILKIVNVDEIEPKLYYADVLYPETTHYQVQNYVGKADTDPNTRLATKAELVLFTGI